MLTESMISPYDRNNYRKWKQWDRSYNMEEMWPKDRYPEAVSPWMYYAGCFVTSLAIMLKRFGVVTEDYETFNPLTLCERIKSVNGFDKDGAVIMECLDRLWPIHYVDDIPYSREALIETLESGMACQLMVRGEAAEYHYVVPDEILERDITVCDCAWPKFKVSDYPEVLYIARYEIRKKNPYGYDCIEVDLEKQTLRCFVGGELKLLTPCVTGQKDDSDTPVGMYHIYLVSRDLCLMERFFGREKHVENFFAFYNGGAGIGIHDACWKENTPGRFARETYLTDGSAGCVHVPVEVSRKLAELVPLGMPVIVKDKETLAPPRRGISDNIVKTACSYVGQQADPETFFQDIFRQCGLDPAFLGKDPAEFLERTLREGLSVAPETGRTGDILVIDPGDGTLKMAFLIVSSVGTRYPALEVRPCFKGGAEVCRVERDVSFIKAVIRPSYETLKKKNKSIKIPFFFEGVTAVYTADDRAVWSFKNGGEESKENFRRLSEELSLPEGRLFHPLQVHGAKVQKVTEDMAGDGTTRAPSVEADGAVTNVPGLALCLIQSDCAPVYFYDPEKRAAGLCHSGRKGTQLHIAAEVIKTMKEAYGTDPEDLFCVIGPHICGKCYEVGKDVAEEFAACFPEEIKKRAVLTENGRITLDLSAAIRSDLLAAGVREDRILRIKECTYENRQLFSYRRGDGVRSDLSAIVIR